MKTIEEFKQFYDTDLQPTLQALELKRKKAVKLVAFLVVAVVGAVVLALGASTLFPSENLKYVGIGVSALAGIVFIVVFAIKINRAKKAIKLEYKQEVIKEMIAFVDPNLTYTATGSISEGAFNGSKIFLKDPDRYKGDDLIQGTIGSTEIDFSEIHAEYYTTDKDGNRKYHTIFKGIFFIADFHKDFHGETIVLPDTAEKFFGKLGTLFQKMNISRPKLVKLENPEFEKAFAVYGTDQVEARYILTPSLMERIMDFRKKSGKIHLSFLHSKVYIAISVKNNLFEPPFFKSMLKFELIEEYFNYLILSVNIVEDLDLNTRIWSKE
ncbi:MAG: DUF3137 domain-containing protein [bacterium]|nr:DUF3137 domain-containing protein [bacterium]